MGRLGCTGPLIGRCPMTETKHPEGQPGIATAALFGLCPQCGAKSLFAGPVSFAPHCTTCDLDYAAFNVGDGPAALLTMALGALIIVLAFILEIAAHPPFWLHALLWVPLTVILVVLSLRFAKGALLVAEHRNKAKEGKLVGMESEI
jgi:uncharacterized protein (DUF983 family)